MKRVLILQRLSGNYRVPFYNQLNHLLKSRNISLRLIYGQPSKFETYVEPEKCIPGIVVATKYVYVAKRYLFWQPVWKYIFEADLVIVQQSTKFLNIYPLLLYRKFSNKKVAFWGHGGKRSEGTKQKGIASRFKKFYSTKVDHWFAYNDLVKEIVRSFGYPEDRITSVQNSIDTETEKQIYHSISETEVKEMCHKYRIQADAPVGVFCSRLYKAKRLAFLLRALAEVHKQIANFHFFVIGDGQDSQIIRDFEKENSAWFHWAGSQYGKDKVTYFKLAQFQLIPGLVGLNIVDSFALEAPMITTENDLHSVEISYLKNWENGIMTPNSLEDYVNAVVRVATDSDLRETLFAGCREAAEHYTIENMALNFADGIIKTLVGQ